MGGPGFPDEPTDDDECVSQGDERFHDPATTLGAHQQLLEPAVVPRVRALDDPPGPGLQRLTLFADHPVATEFGEQIPGLV